MSRKKQDPVEAAVRAFLALTPADKINFTRHVRLIERPDWMAADRELPRRGPGRPKKPAGQQQDGTPLEPVERAEKILKSGIAAYITEQRRIEEEARRAEALRAQQEAERQRILAAIEAQKAQKHAEEERMKLALQAEKAGASAENITVILEQPPAVTQEEVAAILQDPIVIAPRPIQPTYQAVKGISTRDNWKFEIINAAIIPREYLIPDAAKIGGVVRAMKSSANIPGIRVYNEPTAVGRTS